jgi:hypothetical protein
MFEVHFFETRPFYFLSLLDRLFNTKSTSHISSYHRSKNRDCTKLEAGRMELEHISFSTRDVILDSLDVVRSKANAKNITLKQDFATCIPENRDWRPESYATALAQICSKTRSSLHSVNLEKSHSPRSVWTVTYNKPTIAAAAVRMVVESSACAPSLRYWHWNQS